MMMDKGISDTELKTIINFLKKNKKNIIDFRIKRAYKVDISPFTIPDNAFSLKIPDDHATLCIDLNIPVRK